MPVSEEHGSGTLTTYFKRGKLFMYQYFVISPNAWKDGKAEVYLKYMKAHHVVFMGWDKGNRFGRMFANAKVGDRVIVAQGANWQKRSFFAGIIDSAAKYDKESGNDFTQYRDLRAFVELDTDELPFSIQCTYGASSRIPAICRLKQHNQADLKIISRVEKILNKFEFSYTLKEVANWKDNHRVDIPALQRGIVWEPRQVEILWDSILRGFPIGSFVITTTQNNMDQVANKEVKSEYFLLDGQQRYNAIALAFSPIDENSKSALWIDLLPQINKNSSRKFWAKVTTVAHPWGYANNDNCSVLSWRRCRAAIKEFIPEADPNIIKLKDIKLTKSYPVEAKCPVLLNDLITAWLKNREFDSFLKKTMDNLGPKGGMLQEIDTMTLVENLKELWDSLHVLINYRITANILDNNMIADEDENQVGNTSNLEHLFTRLNTMGSKISPYDLRYSAIKAYWSTIKEKNDELAALYMPAPHLAILAFRLALTKLALNEKSEHFKFSDTPSISLIREIGSSNDSRKEYIQRIYDDSLNEISLRKVLEKVENKLVKQGLPPVLRTAIALNSPDVYLLLMYLASDNLLDEFDVIGLSTWIHWFAIRKNKKNITDSILNAIQVKKKTPSWSSMEIHQVIKDSLSMSVKQGWLIYPIAASPDNFDFTEGSFDKSWLLSQFEEEPWQPLYKAIAYNRELLIFSERNYFLQKFEYDPAQTDLLRGHNRPWDYDHIIPKAWMSRQGKSFGDWRYLCREWLWNIGNFAAIPFFINRSKSDKACWTEYINNQEDLHWDEGIKDLREDKLTEDEFMARKFAHLTSCRLVNIYNDWRKTVNSLCDFSPAESQGQTLV